MRIGYIVLGLAMYWLGFGLVGFLVAAVLLPLALPLATYLLTLGAWL